MLTFTTLTLFSHEIFWSAKLSSRLWGRTFHDLHIEIWDGPIGKCYWTRQRPMSLDYTLESGALQGVVFCATHWSLSKPQSLIGFMHLGVFLSHRRRISCLVGHGFNGVNGAFMEKPSSRAESHRGAIPCLGVAWHL